MENYIGDNSVTHRFVAILKKHTNMNTPDQTYRIFFSGCFNLDPNRVLDIILESFEARPHLEKLFIPLIKNYMGDPHVISEVLGFKLGNMEVLDTYKEPPALMTVIALLLQHQVIALDDIYPWVCERYIKILLL